MLNIMNKKKTSRSIQKKKKKKNSNMFGKKNDALLNFPGEKFK